MSETNVPATQDPKVVAERNFKSEMTQMQPQFASALPAHVPPEKFVRVAMTAVLKNPDLLTMNRKLLFQELIACAADGLIPDGREAAILPFKGKPKYLPMIAGILKKMRNSGDLKSINPMVVYQNDEFEYWMDENGPHLKHVPCFDRDPGPVRLTYAVGITKDGGVYIEPVTEAQMEKIKKASAAGNSGPWGGDFADEMRKKSALKRLSKRMPSSTDLDEILSRDEEITDPHDDRTPVPSYQTIEIPSQQIAAAMTQNTAAAEKSEPKKEEARPSGLGNAVETAIKRGDAKPVFNHAPGASNPPPAPVTQQTGSVQDRPATAQDVPQPTVKSLGMEVQRICKAIGWTPVVAAERIKKMTGKLPNELAVGEMGFLIEELKTAAAELGVSV